MPDNTAINEILAGLEAGNCSLSGARRLAAAATPPRIPPTICSWSPSSPRRVTVSRELRKNLTGAAQYIENFKHRKTLTALMNSAFQDKAGPGELHRSSPRRPNCRCWWTIGTTMPCS